MSNNSETDSANVGIKWFEPAFLIATWFGAGKIPFAPGTWGSFFTFPLFLLSHYLLVLTDSYNSFVVVYVLLIMLLFVVGMWSTSVYMKKTGKHDPKEVVIDEVVGQIIVFFAAGLAFSDFIKGKGEELQVTVTHVTNLLSTPMYILCLSVISFVGFLLFRLFDIWKPWPIGYCDKNIDNAFGVMFDDVFAAVYAVIAFYGLLLAAMHGYSVYI